MNELTTSHQLFLGKDYSRRNTQEQLMEDEDGNNACLGHTVASSAMSSGVVLGQENHYGRLPTPSIPKLQRLREVTGESLTGDLLGLTPGVDTGGV